MRKKVTIFLIATITIINIIAGSLIFLDVQLMETPETTITIDILEINSDKIIIQTIIDVFNPNGFGIITKNLELITTDVSGSKVAYMLIDGGDILPNENKTFISDILIDFDGYRPKTLTTKITGTIGAHLGIIQKTIPLNIIIVTAVEDIIRNIAPPIIHIQVDFDEITQEQINITGIVEAYNPNTFDLYMDNASINVETETGKNVGSLTLEGNILSAKSTVKINSKGGLLIEALNAEMLTINISATANAKIADFNKSLPFYAEIKMNVPDIGTLLSSDSPFDMILRGDFKLSIDGLTAEMTLEINNPNKIVLETKDVIVSLYEVNNDIKQLIGECKLNEGIIEKENMTALKGKTVIPYSRLITPKDGNIIPEGILMIVRGNVTIQGLNQSIWIGFGGYQNLHPFR